MLVKFLNHQELVSAEAEFEGRILKVTEFSASREHFKKRYLFGTVALAPLEDKPYEVWISDDLVDYFSDGAVMVSRAAQRAVVRVSIAEKSENHVKSLGEVTEEAYMALFRAAKSHKLGKLVKIWNYIPDILKPASGTAPKMDRERYRQFNSCRFRAWLEHGPRDQSGNPLYPAATGVGTTDAPLVLEALFSVEPVTYLENPRQQPAYEYPRRFGSTAPTFARAALAHSRLSDNIFISGTGSILGAETVHKGYPKAQIKEVLENLHALIEPGNLERHLQHSYPPTYISVARVYVRDRENYEVFRSAVENRLGRNAQVIYLHSELCRPDLLLEIEGIALREPAEQA